MNRSVLSVIFVVMMVLMVGSVNGAYISNISSVFSPPTNQGYWQSGGGGFVDPSAAAPATLPSPDLYADPTTVQLGLEPNPWVWLTGSVTDLSQQMGPEFTIMETIDFPNPAPPPQFLLQRAVHTYAFRVTLTNNASHPISPVHIRLTNVNLSPANFNQIAFTPLSWDGTNYPGSLVSQYDSTWNTQFVTLPQHQLLFGGLSGGGGQLLPGETGDLYFGVRFGIMGPSSSGLIRMALVPSPEPTSMMLGALGLIGGVLLVRRRRSKKVAQDAQP